MADRSRRTRSAQISLFELGAQPFAPTAAGAQGTGPAPPWAGSPQPRAAPSDLRVVVLGSGSRGNAVLIEAAGKRLLVDAGFSGRELEQRLRALDIPASSSSGLVLPLEHGDHCRGAERLVRRHRLPVFATPGTLADRRLRRLAEVAQPIRSGGVFEIAGFRVAPFAVAHDAREPIGVVVEDQTGCRVGVVGDLGTRSQLAWSKLRDLSVLVIEANHDLDLLRTGPYPWALKQRIASRYGHLSNGDAAAGLPELLCDRLQTIVLYHLSEINNQPALAAAEVGEVLEHEGSRARLVIAEQDRPTPWLDGVPEPAPAAEVAV